MPKPDPVEELRHRVFTLGCELEEPLDQALALARVLDLMGFGLRAIHNDHGPALLAIAEALTSQLSTAKETWRQIMATSSRAPARRRPKWRPKA